MQVVFACKSKASKNTGNTARMENTHTKPMQPKITVLKLHYNQHHNFTERAFTTRHCNVVAQASCLLVVETVTKAALCTPDMTNNSQRTTQMKEN
jgi:hypothetical protein